MKQNHMSEAVGEWIKIYWWGLLLVGLGFAVAFHYVAPAPPRQITIVTGSETGGYHRFGQQLKARLEKKGLKVTLRPTGGTIENLELLANPTNGVDLAFGEGGAERFVSAPLDNVRSLGSLFYEPLWIFCRKDSNIHALEDLKHCKVAIGKNGSGTQMLSKTILREAGIPESCWVSVGSADAVKAIRDNQVQAIFLVAPVNDPMDKAKAHPDVYELMSDPNLALFGTHRAQAYVSRLPYLAMVNIGEGLVDLAQDYPPQSATLVSPLATLQCRENFDGGLALLVLETCRDIQAQGSWLEKAGEFPAKTGVTFPLLPEAKQYLEKGPSFFYKFMPFWAANMANRLWIMAIPLLTLLIPSFKLALPTYRWRIRRKIATKYRTLMAIDRKITTGAIRQSLDEDIAQLRHYEDELTHLHVPIMFANDYYTLRSHVRYLRTQLEELKHSPAK